MKTTADELHIDAEFRALIPPLSPEEFAQLEANIKADGCRDPIVVWNEYDPKRCQSEGLGVCKDDNCRYGLKHASPPISKWIPGDGIWTCPECGWGLLPMQPPTVIDGHNRHVICEKYDIEFDTVEMEFADRDAAKVWIIRNQFGRRNITLASRCKLAESLVEALRPKSEQIWAESGKETGRGNKKVSSILKKPSVDAWDSAAREANISTGTLSAYRFLKENAPEKLDQLQSDPNAKLHRVVKEVRETKQREARQSKRVEAAKAAPKMDDRIIVGDFREHADKIADGSLSLIFTDPPYDRDAAKMFPDLAKFAADKLADGGSLICYVGHIQLIEALDGLRKHLRFWWPIACVHAGGKVMMNEYGIKACWKPVLWFVKGTRDDKSIVVNDVMSGDTEKSHHDWQQSQSEAEYWVDHLCPSDGIVCDPFLGGGTTAAAAKKLNRKWVGFEVNEENAAIASQRIGGGK